MVKRVTFCYPVMHLSQSALGDCQKYEPAATAITVVVIYCCFSIQNNINKKNN